MRVNYEKYLEEIPISNRKWPDELPAIDIDLIGFCARNKVSVEIRPNYFNQWIKIQLDSTKGNARAYQLLTRHDLIACQNPTELVQTILNKLLHDINEILEDL